MLHNPFFAAQKEIERATQTIQEQNGHHLLYCNTTTTRQNKLYNSKNKMEQFARYLLGAISHSVNGRTIKTSKVLCCSCISCLFGVHYPIVHQSLSM
jgi:hypothetical protein